MTLKDFFTLTELKDGLTIPTRVNELLTVMQTEKEVIVNSIGEKTRQWFDVATTIAITENKECLDLFIQLDGLWFINKWLNNAQMLINDVFSEELIVALLRSLEKLQVDHQRSVGSGIGLTVQSLVGHSSLVVREKAKALCDRWSPIHEIDAVTSDVNSVAISPCRNDNEENVEQETGKDQGPLDPVENEKSKSESVALTGISSPLDDVKEKQEIDSSTNISGPVKDETLTSSAELDDAIKTDIKEISDKDEDMMDEDHLDDSNGGSGESSGPKTRSNTVSDEAKENDGIESEDYDSGIPKRSMNGEENDLISKRRTSDMELDYGMVDPLELARQVAIEVEQEVDSQEESCSTSTIEKEHQLTADAASGKEVEVSSGPAPEPKPVNNDVEKGFSGFDLNQQIFSEEPEYPVDQVLTPISIVSASRAAAAADGLPVAPLQFEGTLGWKGSAATSAFRRIPEAEKTFSFSSSHTQRLNRLDFDLNVSDSSEDKLEDFLSRDKMPITRYPDEQEPSSSMKLDRLQLDLNSLGNSDWKPDTRVTSFRNMDLNLNNNHPNIPNNPSLDNNPFLGKLFDSKRDESVISIFGTQVEVNPKQFIPPFQPNRTFFDPSVDFSLGKPGSGSGLGSSIPYGYGHNGFSVGPMYGPPIPYMVPTAFSQQTQPPFIFNNIGDSNGAGPSRNNNFDLNSGFITEMGNRENNNLGLRQFFNNGQASSSSVIGGKREEPDSGWELFPINYKHQQPPWQ